MKRTGIAALLLLLAVVSANAQFQVCQNMQVREARLAGTGKLESPGKSLTRRSAVASPKDRAKQGYMG
jgi:hypothetical protein